jgi:NitT/TauT family transport system ATP-binding protein
LIENKVYLRAKNISLARGPNPVLDDLSIEVLKGEVFGVLGRIGVGKTSLLRLVAGLEVAEKGAVEFETEDLRKHVSYIFQDDQLLPWLTVEENLQICLRDRNRELPKAALTEFAVDSLLDKYPSDLSGGMRQKVNFSRGFLNRDPLILMDEPFGALDPVQKRDLQTGFLKLQKTEKCTVIFVTHDIQEALFACHRISMLSGVSRKIVRTIENPFQSQEFNDALFNNVSYRNIFSELMRFYEAEGKTS